MTSFTRLHLRAALQANAAVRRPGYAYEGRHEALLLLLHSYSQPSNPQLLRHLHSDKLSLLTSTYACRQHMLVNTLCPVGWSEFEPGTRWYTDCHSYEKRGLHYIVWVLLASCSLLSWYCHVTWMNRWDKVVPLGAINSWDFLSDFTNTAVLNTAINHQQSGFHVHRWACVHCTNTYLLLTYYKQSKR